MSDETTLYKILAGETRFKIKNQEFCVRPPLFSHLYEASNLYRSVLKKARLLGAVVKDDLYHYMILHNLWSLKEENELNELPEILQNEKANLYESYIALKNTEFKRKTIEKLTERLYELLRKKSVFDSYTAEGIALFHKLSFLICCGSNIDYYGQDNVNLRLMYNQYCSESVSDYDIRKIAKSNTYKHFWESIKLGYRLFGEVLTQEQYSLLNWWKFYDSVYESADRPDMDIIMDDDLLDGWCIIQSRKRKEDEKRRSADRFGNAGEIFLPADNAEHAARINSLNDGRNKLIKKQREHIIQQKGFIEEQNMPDSKLEIRQMATQMFMNKVKNK